MKLLSYFSRYMREHLIKTGSSVIKESDSMSRTPHLYQWCRSTSGVLMQLNNGTVQVSDILIQSHFNIATKNYCASCLIYVISHGVGFSVIIVFLIFYLKIKVEPMITQLFEENEDLLEGTCIREYSNQHFSRKMNSQKELWKPLYCCMEVWDGHLVHFIK